MNSFLGIDTSAYTSSLALVDEEQNIIADERMILQVGAGKRGLRQSEAFFQHIKNLPFLFERLACRLDAPVKAIGASAWPRRAEGSYMPVFSAGFSQAEALSHFTGIPLCPFSHQEGHIMAGIKGNEELLERAEFLAVHFSGGTSELLHVQQQEGGFLDIQSGLSGLDLHAGQLVDRIGVAMGLAFPSGPQLEKIARQSIGENLPIMPSSVGDKGFSFSGAETRAQQLIKQGIPYPDIALASLRCIANTLEKSILLEAGRKGIKDVLLVGGVMANTIIKDRLLARLEHPAVGLKLFFASPGLSSDNAVGVALAAQFILRKADDG
ncbi:MAG: peptidase M22 [Syntrophomonas sp.]|uniref:peptidase M22 n=1 Tax=Syntrophomonas sp. TaxID=2053627 RepID=UPI002628A6F8|nr:peptidase M22 [Syntrophomonas sp.]MDD2510252.1 peptidase M22 [Syntrophomonas sp.]MDD3878810.1 peptidase M22 [Syntrophomonas sp.]MDD4626836.1 peptidase M22 [Syntrophomonas sp.]